MGFITWGELNKAQDDPQKIIEAVEALIQAHNDDPEAHGQEDQALERHRTNEIIDHPAESIVPDKLSSKYSIFSVPIKNFQLGSLFDGFWTEQVGGGGEIEWDNYGDILSGVSMNAVGDDVFAELSGFMPANLDRLQYQTSFMLDIFGGVLFDGASGQHAYFGMFSIITEEKQGAYFEFKENAVRAVWYRDGSFVYSDWLTVSTYDRWYHMRFAWDPFEKIMTFVINSHVLAVFNVEEIPAYQNALLRFRVEGSSEVASATIQVFNFVWYFGLPPL